MPCGSAAAAISKSGSIFVAEGNLKAIDAEFGYFGPIGFDVGTAIGSCCRYCGLPGRLHYSRRRRRARTAAERYPPAVDHLRQTLGASDGKPWRGAEIPGYASAFLKKVWADAVGFCGSELIPPQRRAVRTSRISALSRTTPCVSGLPAPRHYPPANADCAGRAYRQRRRAAARVPSMQLSAACFSLTRPSP